MPRGRPRKLRGVGEQPMQPTDRIRAATTIEQLMPDKDRRDVALGGIAKVVEHAHELYPGADFREDRRARGRELNQDELAELQRLANGRSQEEAAGDLNVTLPLFKSRLKEARKKLGARGTVHAIAEAMRRGLIE